MTPRQLTPVLAAAMVVLSLLATARPASAQAKKPQLAEVKRTVLNVSAVRPGDKAMLAVEVEIKEGYHAQSRTPTQPTYVKFDLALEPHEALTFGEPIYPPGKEEEYKELGKLNVYTGTVVVRVPVEVKPDAKPGPVTIAGKLKYQICDDKVCYRPEQPKVEIKSEIVAAGTEVKPNEPDLFKDDGATKPTEDKGDGKDKDKGESAAATPVQPPSQPPGQQQQQPATIFGKELASNAYFLAFFGAFVVGIIFNIMPCVLPVVPLKIMGFYEVAQHSRSKSLAFGAVFSAGLVASFGVLAVLIVALRVIDWGGLFTKWWFIIPMVVILVAMAVSMFGFFTVNVPTGLYNIAPRHDTYVGNFLFGVLTAALSTPCTFGMFVGLLAWALTQPAVVGVALIMTVGVGMAFPYFVLSAFPELARRFPRGGAWGEVVKQFMGFLLLATAAYFAGPLIAAATNLDVWWWTVFAMLAAGALFVLVRGTQASKTAVGRVAAVVVAVLVLAPSLYAVRALTAKPFEWQAFSTEALEKARADGKVVLVEFTATWCGNCHLLEASVLKSPTIVDVVRQHDVVMLKADVTNDDAPGVPLLREFSPASAIPLTVVFPPHADKPIQLTGIYEKAELKRVLEDASSRERVAAVR